MFVQSSYAHDVRPPVKPLRALHGPTQGRVAERTSPVPAEAESVLSTSGAALAEPDRVSMERRLGHDFSQVRVHSSPEAASTAARLGAAAFTVGEHVVFAAGRLAPRTAAGRALLAHELGHVVEQRSGARPRELARQPAHPPPHPANADPQAKLAQQDAAALAALKDRVLKALERNDAIDFLNRLREANSSQRKSLPADGSFLAKVHGALHGLAYWTVLLLLRFGDNRPSFVRQLYQATSEGQVQTVLDLLRSFPALRDETAVPGTVQMLDEQLRGNPFHDKVLAVARENVTAASQYSGQFGEAHWDVPKGGGAAALLRFGGDVKFTLARTATELRVVVRIQLVKKTAPAQTYFPPDSKMSEWRNGIQKAWNNRFTATNGSTRLNVVFVPMFVNEVADQPDFTVQVDESPKYVRADETDWWANNSGDTVAHEFGHMLGNPDEYGLPAHASDIPAATLSDPGERLRSSQEGLPAGTKTQSTPEGGRETLGLMGRHTANSRAELRHGWKVLEQFNSAMLRPGESPFHLEVH